MAYEVEQKFAVEDAGAIGHRIEQRGGEPGEPLRQVDTYFAHPARDFAQTDEALRLRSVGETRVVTYKGPKLDVDTLIDRTKTRREIELPLAGGGPEGGEWRELLLALGFAPVREVAKWRTPYRLTHGGRQFELALDDVDGLGSFVEIETVAEQADLEDARRLVADLASRLGLDSPERRSYLEMLLEASRHVS